MLINIFLSTFYNKRREGGKFNKKQVYFKGGVRIKIKCKYGKIIDSNSLFEYNYAVMV
ncbi:hypothetical protein HMPREF1039_1385 [Megasphaera lornae]|jgi:hypothetical protein|uniref:Transposase DDE domain-containing protein n=1 Tax=Megasphaera lornae TaxID=1000568 RepID=A0ABN0CZF4_9FIRM|nr:hypothetical protein HMPREF1039_1385 [Megasphaera lornae]